MNDSTPAAAKPAVVLLSGGLDSTTCVALARELGFEVHALTVAYGQRHDAELAAARNIASAMNVRHHKIAAVDLGEFGGSALTDDIQVPKDTPHEDIGKEIPVTYVPARNTVFLSMALAFAEVVGAEDIFLGVNALDYSGYPDCRPEFIRAFESLANLATKAGSEGKSKYRIHTPLIDMTKADIIKRGTELGVDYSLTVSCYDPGGGGGGGGGDGATQACGRCEACALRRRGFAEAQIEDPTNYQTGAETS